MIYYTKKRQYGTSFSKCVPRIALEKEKIITLSEIKNTLQTTQMRYLQGLTIGSPSWTRTKPNYIII